MNVIIAYHQISFVLDHGYKWMECSFSAGDFKYTRASREKPAEKEKESEEAAAERGFSKSKGWMH